MSALGVEGACSHVHVRACCLVALLSPLIWGSGNQADDRGHGLCLHVLYLSTWGLQFSADPAAAMQGRGKKSF